MGRHSSIFLIGPMGAGKTTVGRLLARRTGRRFVDSDRELERRSNATIEEMFRLEGEAGFRAREAALLEDLTREPGVVLATGGGAVLLPENRRALGARGAVVYLRATVDAQWERLRQDKSRPLLQTADPRATLADLFAERDPLYRELCDHRIDMDGLRSHAACRRAIAALGLEDEVLPDAERCAP